MINFLIQAGTMTGCKSIIGGLLMGATTFFANPEAPTKPMSFDASVYVTAQGKVRLAVQKSMPGVVTVQLLDQYKNVLYTNTLSKKDMKAALSFDMSEVGDGTYTLEISSAGGVIQKQVTVSTPKAERLIAFQ